MPVQIARETVESFRRLLTRDEVDTLAINQRINQHIRKGDFAFRDHFVRGLNDRSPAVSIMDRDTVQLSIVVDHKHMPDKALRIGDYVNILGALPTKDGKYKTYRIIEWLKVAAIGQFAYPDDSPSTRPNAAECCQPHKMITVEMKRKNPDVSLQWSHLQSYLRGSPIIEICPARFMPRKGTAGVIAEELLGFTKECNPEIVPDPQDDKPHH